MTHRIEIERRFSLGKRIFGLSRIMMRSSTNASYHVGLATLLVGLCTNRLLIWYGVAAFQ